MKILLISICLLIAGCGTLSEADYVLISKGQADGINAIFTGGVGYCKLTIKGKSIKVNRVSADELKRLCESVPQ
jgi:hypothetical protein